VRCSHCAWVGRYQRAPKSLEGLYQEIGRAGRDGLPAEAVTLYAKSDITRLRRIMSMPTPGVRTRDRKAGRAGGRGGSEGCGAREKADASV
jgi:superfamily II DNA helicase RecQ